MTAPFAPAQAHSFDDIRAFITANMRSETRVDDDGKGHAMVWIPRFVVPPSTLGQWPENDLELGGFWVDKYECSKPDATPHTEGVVTDVACSRPGVRPWGTVTWDDAKAAIEARLFGAVPCKLASLEDWAALLVIAHLLGHELRGNTQQGRDYRDDDEWVNYGHRIAESNHVATGTGPGTWSNNGQQSGLWDLLGNLAEWVEIEGAYSGEGRWAKIRTTTIHDDGGISDGDASVTIDAPTTDAELWPTSGTIRFRAEGINTDEYAKYSNLVDNEDETWTLTGLTRGGRGEAASAHADGAAIELHLEYCIFPESWSAFTVGLNNIDDPADIALPELVGAPELTTPQIGEVFQVESEQCHITDINGEVIRVTRGYNGTAPAAHADWTLATRHPSVVEKEVSSSHATPRFTVFIGSFRREHPDIARLLVPRDVYATAPPATWKDKFRWELNSDCHLLRGGASTQADWAQFGFWARFTATASTNEWGFRGVWRLDTPPVAP